MEGLLLPLVPPGRHTVAVPYVEYWSYNLRSFIVQSGSLDFGHYVAYWRSARGWHEANDNLVTDVALEDVVRTTPWACFVSAEANLAEAKPARRTC